MKILALDLGDRWVGTALSDALGLLARPYKTVEMHELDDFLLQLFGQENISMVVIGYPVTMRATESQQTQQILRAKQNLEKKFPHMQWILWDERLSSKRAEGLKKAKTQEEKRKAHSIAAAFILESYLTYRSLHQPEEKQ